MKSLIFLAILIGACLSSDSNSSNGKRVLVLLNDFGTRETHSNYFKSLKNDGFQLNFKTADDATLSLTKYGEYLYDHLIVFSPLVIEFGGNLSTKAIVDFIDSGRDVLIAASTEVTEPIREIAGECGIEFSDENTLVIDRFNYDSNDDGRQTLIAVEADNLINNKLIVGSARNGAPLLYRGVGMSADAENPLLLSVVHASSTAFAYVPEDKITDYPHSVGRSTLLVASLQARNNARVTFVGSLEFFSNDFFEAPVQKALNGQRFDKSGNEEFSLALTRWTFKEAGVLRYTNVQHHIVGEKQSPEAYTINQDIVYTLTVEEYANGQWVPFQGKDAQLEFIRLDPFVRQTLVNKNGRLEAKFKVPDVYGIFKFVVDYNRVGYTHLFTSTQVSVRPLEHTQYDRFIPAAYPYYAGAFAMIVCVYLFSFVMLYHRDAAAVKPAAKKE